MDLKERKFQGPPSFLISIICCDHERRLRTHNSESEVKWVKQEKSCKLRVCPQPRPRALRAAGGQQFSVQARCCRPGRKERAEVGLKFSGGLARLQK